MDLRSFLNIQNGKNPALILPVERHCVLLRQNRHGSLSLTQENGKDLPLSCKKRNGHHNLYCLHLHWNGQSYKITQKNEPPPSPYREFNFILSIVLTWMRDLTKTEASYEGVLKSNAIGGKTPHGRFLPVFLFDSRQSVKNQIWIGESEIGEERYAERHPFVLMFHGVDNTSYYKRYTTFNEARQGFQEMNGIFNDQDPSLFFFNS